MRIDRLHEITRRNPRGAVLLSALLERLRFVQGVYAQDEREIVAALARDFTIVDRPLGQVVTGLCLTHSPIEHAADGSTVMRQPERAHNVHSPRRKVPTTHSRRQALR